MPCTFAPITKNDIEPFFELDASCYLLCSCRKHLWSKRANVVMNARDGEGDGEGTTFYISSNKSSSSSSSGNKNKSRYFVHVKKQKQQQQQQQQLMLHLLHRNAFLVFLVVMFFVALAVRKNDEFKDMASLLNKSKNEVLPKLSEYVVRVRGWYKARTQV